MQRISDPNTELGRPVGSSSALYSGDLYLSLDRETGYYLGGFRIFLSTSSKILV
jgi:hypothetical protein